MNAWDPARPKLPNGAPTYLSPNGKPIAALVVPQIELDRETPGLFHLYWWLLINPVTARPKIISTDKPWPLIEEYLADPEKFLLDTFGYAYEPGTVKAPESRPVGRPAKPSISLEDLGL